MFFLEFLTKEARIKMLPQICWVITALLPKHEAHRYRSEVHRASEVPGKWISKLSNGQEESGTTQVWIRMLALLSGLWSYIACEQNQSEKYEKSDHLRLPESGWDPQPSLPSLWQRWRLDCLHWLLAHYHLREEGEDQNGLQSTNSIIFPEELRSGEAGEESKLIILGP